MLASRKPRSVMMEEPASERLLKASAVTAMEPETAPAKGLFLMKVFYDRSELENYAPEGVPFWC